MQKGCVKDFEIDLVLKENVTLPVFRKVHTVPYSLYYQVDKKLIQLEQNGITRC